VEKLGGRALTIPGGKGPKGKSNSALRVAAYYLSRREKGEKKKEKKKTRK